MQTLRGFSISSYGWISRTIYSSNKHNFALNPERSYYSELLFEAHFSIPFQLKLCLVSASFDSNQIVERDGLVQKFELQTKLCLE